MAQAPVPPKTFAGSIRWLKIFSHQSPLSDTRRGCFFRPFRMRICTGGHMKRGTSSWYYGRTPQNQGCTKSCLNEANYLNQKTEVMLIISNLSTGNFSPGTKIQVIAYLFGRLPNARNPRWAQGCCTCWGFESRNCDMAEGSPLEGGSWIIIHDTHTHTHTLTRTRILYTYN